MKGRPKLLKNLSGVGRLEHWLDEEIADLDDDQSVVVPHSEIARLSDSAALGLGLPGPTALILNIQHAGTLDQPEFRFEARWQQMTGQPALGVRRSGSILTAASSFYRLPRTLFELLEAIEAFNAATTDNRSARLKAWASVQEHLPDETVRSIEVDKYIQSTRIAHAAAFSISFSTDDDGFHVDPILFGPKSTIADDVDDLEHIEPDELVSEADQLLPPVQNQHFAKNRFRKYDEARSSYVLADGWYIVVDEDVRRALGVVRNVQRADRKTRREFVRNPRAFLCGELGDVIDEAAIERLFVETAEYSARVVDVGFWQPRVLPWVQRGGDSWVPETFGVRIGESYVQLNDGDIEPLREAVSGAITEQRSTVSWNGHDIPATSDTLEALNALAGLISPSKEIEDPTEGEPPKEEEDRRTPLVLIIEENLEDVGYESRYQPRKSSASKELPICLRSVFKEYQLEGFGWLKSAWLKGQPGVLLADDMGLGKTFQALGFLAWLRQAMEELRLAKAPVMIVAPTGLLRNWEEEHDRHLLDPGLGDLVRAYGRDLRDLRLEKGRETDLGRPVLRSDRLQSADWVMTTYETLRDYQHSFAAVRFAAIAFDEIQKIKTPGTVMTHAAKAMNHGFVIGLTGTPIENRLADLWCIVDTVEPGKLKDLATFSRTYERDETEEKFRELKRIVSEPTPHGEALMLRRMKYDRLDGLPSKTEHVLRCDMPRAQQQAYDDAVAQARAGTGRGRMLEALHRLRSASLHPLHPDLADGDDYIEQSARFKTTFGLLDQIAKKNEKALVFVESLEMQPRLAAMIQQRFKLARLPMIISGAVSGPKRQQRVNNFQSTGKGFDVIILSPRAGGVGITLTAANHVIHLSRWWNPAVEDQCTDRVYRIGQEQDVHVYYPLAVHPAYGEQCFDVRLHELLARKRNLSREMLMPPVNRGRDAETLFEETIGRSDGGRAKSKRNTDSAIDIGDIDTMSPLEFENWVLSQLQGAGYTVNKTPKSWDAGADGLATNPTTGREIIIQCKHKQTPGPIDATAVSDLLKARAAYQKDNAGLVAVTNAPGFSGDAMQLATENGVVLCARDELGHWPDCLSS